VAEETPKDASATFYRMKAMNRWFLVSVALGVLAPWIVHVLAPKPACTLRCVELKSGKELWNKEGIPIADLDLDRIPQERQLLDVTGHYARPDVLSLRFNRSPLRSLESESEDSSSAS
jgi:hypothetical protein